MTKKNLEKWKCIELYLNIPKFIGKPLRQKKNKDEENVY